MDSVRIIRSELVGTSKSKTVVLETLVKANALNRTGNIDYNKYGQLDCVGFEKVSEKFVDNFLFKVLVPDYNTKKDKHKKMLRNNFVGSQNRKIRELLAANDLENCVVKAITFYKVIPEEDMLGNMPDRNKNKEVETYYEQVFKIACPNVDYDAVMQFLRYVDYNSYGFFLKDLDITMDYAGSFDKYKCIEHLTTFKDFREQGTIKNGEEFPRTIVNNDTLVGKNCLTWMEEVDGYTTRQKIYNKMVQMLESKSVRNNVGSHWKDWASQSGTRLANARDQAKNRGLTRAEVTFYIENDIPDETNINTALEHIVKYIPLEIVYSTTYANIWKSYCENFKHSLVCIDRSKDIGIIVYTYNQITGNISGNVVEKWNEKEKWCLDKLTLNGNLPLDIIEVTEVTKVFVENSKDCVLDIAGNRYCKINKDRSTIFTTRLVSNKGIFSYNTETYKGENIKLLEKAGFLEHENCIPYLGKQNANIASKADAELRKIEPLKVHLQFRKENKKKREENFKMKSVEELKNIEEKTKPLFLELKNEKDHMDWVKLCKHILSGEQTKKLVDLKQGTYVVRAARKVNSRFGKQYKLLIENDDNLVATWANKPIRETLQKAEEDKSVCVQDDLLYLLHDNLGYLNITGKGDTFNRKKIVYCKLTINTKEDDADKRDIVKEAEKEAINTRIPRENLLPYRDYPNLTTLPIGSLHNVDGWAFLNHYGTERLIISLAGKVYQAGDNLEENIEQLNYMCKIKIKKFRVNRSRNIKFAVCSVYEKGDWTAYLDYNKVDILSQDDLDGETCILDVRTVDVKGQKRKLLLTDRGDGQTVYKLKKSKLEEHIKVGFI